MKNYLQKKIGAKLGVTRAGLPKEVYFEARLKAVEGEVAVFEDEQGREIAVPLDKILLLGPEDAFENDKPRPGFLSS